MHNHVKIKRSQDSTDLGTGKKVNSGSIIIATKKEPKLERHLFFPSIARRLNSKQPDITAAIILYNLSLWQDNPYNQTLLDGKRYCFRSLSQLQEDSPYFKRSQIRKALLRVEQAEPKQFIIDRQKSSWWFWLGKHLRPSIKNTETISFAPDAAEKFGVNEAILLANLEYQHSKGHKGKTDESGNWYGSLGAKDLSKLLPMSEDTIARSLKRLVKEGVLVKHPLHKSHFAFSATLKSPAKLDLSRSAEVNTQAAEVNSEPAEVTSRPAEVNTLMRNRFTKASSRANDEVSNSAYSNQCCNECGNECCKVNETTLSTASPVQSDCLVIGGNSSNAAKLIESIVEDSLAKLEAQTHKAKPQAHVHPDELPLDLINDALDDLPFDLVLDKRSPAKILDERVQDTVDIWKRAGYKITTADKEQLREFLRHNPMLHKEWAEELIFLVPRIPEVLKKGKVENQLFARRIKTAEAFMKYLPQLVIQAFCSQDREKDENGTKHYRWNFEDLEQPYASIVYPHLVGKQILKTVTIKGEEELPVFFIDE